MKKKLLFLIVIFLLAVIGEEIYLISGGKKVDAQEMVAYCEKHTEDEIRYEQEVCYVDSRLLVTAERDVSYKDIEKLVRKEGGSIIGYISVSNDYQIQFENKDYEELKSLIQKWEESKLVTQVTLELLNPVQVQAVEYQKDPWQSKTYPEDAAENWHGINGSTWGVESIDMPKVWDMDIDFKPVNIGIMDSCFDTDNKDLKDAFVKVYNQDYFSIAERYREKKEGHFLDGDWVSADSQNASLAHGSHVAGIIGARNNDFGITGISQNANLYGYSYDLGPEGTFNLKRQ